MPDDPRPQLSICHVGLTAANTDLLGDFYKNIGMRLVGKRAGMAVLELRGDTHLVITRGQPGTTQLDLMVDDLDDTRARFDRPDASPSPITHGNHYHDLFGGVVAQVFLLLSRRLVHSCRPGSAPTRA